MDRRKQQETSAMYKKEGISPLGALGGVLITMPIFISMWRIIGGIPHIKSTTWLTMNFAAKSYEMLFAGNLIYLPLMIVAVVLNMLSQLLPRMLTKKRDKRRINALQKQAMKKQNKTQNIMLVVFAIMPLLFSAGLQIYFIFGSLFTLLQNLISHKIIKLQQKKRKLARGKG
jgi:YidC/Oxa1 family membrane protein insertase